jgi:hypothetical protein
LPIFTGAAGTVAAASAAAGNAVEGVEVFAEFLVAVITAQAQTKGAVTLAR